MRAAVLDIGGTSIKSGIWEDEKLADVQETDTDAMRGGRFVMEKAIGIIEKYKDIKAIGISTAGQVDSEKGRIRYANPNIPEYTGMKIKEIMEKRFGVPAVVENDVNAAAIGETFFGAGRAYRDFLCITYGTGIGGAIVMNREVYKGSACLAGEFGSILTHAGRRTEGDLLSGCYERYASAAALVKKAMEYDKALTNGRKIFERMDEIRIKQMADDWIYEIAFGLVSLIPIFNPACIVLGGGILCQKYIVDRLKEIVDVNIMESFRGVELKQAELGNKAGLFGMAYLMDKEL